MDKEKYVTSKIAQSKLGVCNRTLRNWAVEGKIDFILTNGKWRRYNIDKYMKEKKIIEKRNVCYARVSTYDQKEDLANQIQKLVKLYPTYEIIQDIGSGINFKRKGIRRIIDLAISGELGELVVSYKDRLCRIGFELLEYIITKYSNAKIITLNNDKKNDNQIITEDLIEIMTVYSSKIYGKRHGRNFLKTEDSNKKRSKSQDNFPNIS